jgi:predicted ATP-binding protein involved in virulence
MSFKLLAIRPLEGTDPSLLKGLKPNCIYRFYNEYDYLYEYDENIGKGKSFIELQEQYFNSTDSKNDNYTKLDKKNIKAIKFNKQLPDDFFGENINVSAIVGENGSGKSSLLELFYLSIAFVENGNYYYCHAFDLPNIVLELFFQKNNDIIKVSVDTIRKGTGGDIKYSERNYVNNLFSEGVYVRESNKSSSNQLLTQLYSHVLNYSLYGLNSTKERWLDRIYEVGRSDKVISINPNRQKGIIDINEEEVLAYRRLLIYVYGFKENRLLNNVKIESHNIFIDLKRISFFSEEERGKFRTTEISVVKSFYELISIVLDFKGGDFRQSSIVSNNKFDDKEKLEPFILQFLSFVKGEEYNRNDVVFNIANIISKTYDRDNYKTLDIEWSSFIHYLNFVYSFKEYMILLFTYEKLHKYKFLFSIDKQVFQKKLHSIIRKSNGQKKVKLGVDTDIEMSIKRIFKKNVKNLGTSDIYYLVDSLVDYYCKTVINLMNNKEIYGLNYIEREGNITYILVDSLKEEVIKSYNSDFLKSCLQSSFKDINKDSSRNTFELKQAINYFYSEILDDVVNQDVKEDNILSVSLDSKYFTDVSKIEEIPLALFSYEINVVKVSDKRIGNEKHINIFEFNKLSSGELQNINSILQVVYEVYNHIVNINAEKIKEVYVNLIYDEIEMHLHPDYQRKYLKNILIILQQVFKSSNFLKHNVTCKCNIVLATHSPFILSDIPSQNVLKLQDGKPVKGDEINSFGANIHDLLADEFFLKDCFMGEFAKEKINSIIKFLHLKNSIIELDSNISNSFFSKDMQDTFKDAKSKLSIEFESLNIKYSKEEVEQHIKLIGEPMLAIKIKEMSDKAFNGE